MYGAKIAKVESRGKACFDYAETKLSSAEPTIAKVERRANVVPMKSIFGDSRIYKKVPDACSGSKGRDSI